MAGDPNGTFSPYDYLYDREGNIYVVRGSVPGHPGVVARLVYENVPGGPRKRTHYGRLAVPSAPDPSSVYALPEDRLLRPSQVRRHVRRDSRGPLSRREWHGSLVASLLDALTDRGATLYSFGSRVLGMGRDGSDWDFLLSVRGNPRPMIADAIEGRGGGLSFLDDAEVEESIRRYGHEVPYADRDLLTRVKRRTTLYLRGAGARVDFFAISPDDGLMPALDIDRLETADVLGTILPSEGQSYLMPRRVRVRESSGMEVTVIHTCWPLLGIEAFAGHQVRMDGVFRSGPNSYWFSQNYSTLRSLSREAS
jgi:hypothetical protein